MPRATVSNSGVVGVIPLDDSPRPTLSGRLRLETAPAHLAVEAAARLPARIVTVADYAACLRRFLQLFGPLEAAIAGFPGWADIGINLAARRRTPALLADLRILGCEPPVPAAIRLFGFAAALGALYVLEGSALGGRILATAFERQLPEIAGATQFFGGDGARTGEKWQEFRTALDLYGENNPGAAPAVVAGAVAAFGRFAIGLA